MGDRAGNGPPYATAVLIFKAADSPSIRPYTNGRLALAGIDSRVPAATFLDALHAIVAEAPHEVLDKFHRQLVIQSARMRPDRETWGATPEQAALSAPLTGQDKPGGALRQPPTTAEMKQGKHRMRG